MSLAVINRTIVLYLGSFYFIFGIIGSLIQILVFMIVSYYRKTPCTFYFMIAAIHEFGLFITAIGPYIIAASLDIDLARTSVIWCKLRYFFAVGFGAIASTCACFATIDQFLITSQRAYFRQMSTIKNAHRATFLFIIIGWLHGSLWLYFQDMSPITGICIYRSKAFFAYTAVLFCFGIGILPIFIMMTFGILAYQNIKNIAVVRRLRIDRQFTTIVFVQILLTLIGLSPYGIYLVYITIKRNVGKNPNQQLHEAVIANIAYLFCSVAYGGRFYLFMFRSARFRGTVRKRLFWWT